MESIVEHDKFKFTYQLKNGISNDRIGYSIMKNEGVIKLLEQL
jgi:DNA mismatch repair protein MutS